MKLNFLIIFLLIFSTGCAIKTIDSNEIGVVINNLPLPPDFEMGVSKNVLQAGKHFYIPMIQEIHTFNKSIQSLTLGEKNDIEGTNFQSLRIKTAEGNNAYVKIVLTYKLLESRAFFILNNFGKKDLLLERMLQPTARSHARTIFGKLNTSNFSVPLERRAKSAELVSMLNKKLNHFGIFIVDVNIVEFKFNPKYEDKVREKEVFNQDAEKLEYQKKSILASIEANKREAEGTASQKVQEAKGYNQLMITKADSIAYQKNKEAEGFKVSLVNEAKGQKLISAAMSGPGGANMVASEIAKSIQDKKIILLPINEQNSLNVTNVNDLLQKFMFTENMSRIKEEKKEILLPRTPQKDNIITPAKVKP